MKVLMAIVVVAVVAASAIVTPSTESAASDGFDPNADIHAFNAPFHGDTTIIEPESPVIGIAAKPDNTGYWVGAADGGVFNFGSAPFLGSLGDLDLAQPIVGMAAHPSGDGFWMVASDGGVFAFGSAGFFGSLGNLVLDQPIVGMAAHPSGEGYWLTASDGGVFAFGASRFFGSMGGLPLNRPVVGMAAHPSGEGYWLTASDGGIFSFGEAPFHGSTGAITLDQPVVAMAATPSGRGYWLAAADGGVFSFGDAGFEGSAASPGRTEPVVAMSARSDESGYLLVRAAGPSWPLTGRPVTEIDPRPALAVKIDNHSFARGQWGLAQADIVVEEVVEAGITRFIAIFHSTDPGTVGPTRSARESDQHVLPMFGRTMLAFSGGNRFVRDTMTNDPRIDAVFPTVEYGNAYYRTSRRRQPHNLLARTDRLWSFAPVGSTAPRPVFDYRDEVTSPNPTPDTTPLALEFGNTSVTWQWDGTRYTRSHGRFAHRDANLDRVGATNVVVLDTAYLTSPSTGSPVAQGVGSGAAIVLVDGTRIDGTWTRGTVDEPYRLTRNDNAQPIELAPGNTWLELVPSGFAPFAG